MKKFFSKIAQRAFALAISIMVVTNTFAQGAAGIDAASSELATYMDPLGNMMMILGGLVGLVGAVRVYLKWNSGDQDVQKAVMGWMGSCIFLVVSGVVVNPSYNVYKGLQKPLIFKGFKGKFIYIGGACIISALLLCAIVSTLASFMWGGITLVIVMFGGLGITSQLQRKGLHRKDKRKGIYIVSRTFIRDRKK